MRSIAILWMKLLINSISKKSNYRCYIKFLQALPSLFPALDYTDSYPLWQHKKQKK